MTELVDVSDLESDVERRVGSSPTIRTNKYSRSSAGSEHLSYKQKVGGSNPPGNTIYKNILVAQLVE